MAKAADAGILSGSTNGRPLNITATTSGGAQTVHTVGASVDFEEVYLWATNISASDATLFVGVGGVADEDMIVKGVTIPANSTPVPVCIGQRFKGGVVVKAWAGTTAVINVTGGYTNATTG